MTDEPEIDSDPDLPQDTDNPCQEPQKRGWFFYFAILLMGILIFLVVFVNVPAMQSSAGTTITRTGWQLQSIANTSGGMEPTGDTGITVRFTRDGMLSGFAGCNEYRATYTTHNYAITITTPATSRKYCPEPGVMERETLYLENLNTTTEFRVTDEALKLYNKTGKPVLAYTTLPS
ncbi:META domain-containing protein [Methanoregula sp.]|uniref:META domain-containing protein n=1 Tax=Methanoregula sp. TaxID=2052170 RepID=UPI0035666602